MKKLLFISFLFIMHSAFAQVGIGTNLPNANSVLELASPNKGLLLPRINDTGVVNNPSAGLMIYDVNGKAPAFYNGTNWNTFSNAVVQSTLDSIVYNISGPGSGLFTTGNFNIDAFSNGASRIGSNTNVQDFSFSKAKDINTTNFMKALLQGNLFGQIEFSLFSPGSSTPYFSIKLNNCKVNSFSYGAAAGNSLNENISIEFTSIGFKDWTNSLSFSYNIATATVGTY